MQWLLSLAVFAFAFATPPGAVAQPTEIGAELQACVRDYAPTIERNVDDLAIATDFLVSKVCAVPLATEFERANAARMATFREQLRQQCAERPAEAPSPSTTATDEETRVYSFDPCSMLEMSESMANFSNDEAWGAYVQPAPPHVIQFASRLLLELRAARR